MGPNLVIYVIIDEQSGGETEEGEEEGTKQEMHAESNVRGLSVFK
jgi:hypothetical protein